MIYRFGEFELREEDFCLMRDGVRLALEPKNLRVLLHLVSHAGHLVGKDTLLESVWAGTFVEENTLVRAIALLRRELGDSPRNPTYIQTIPTRGYRFIAPVEILPHTPKAPPNAEEKPSQPNPDIIPQRHPTRRRPVIAAALAACLLVFAAAWMLHWRGQRPASAPHQAFVSIAVLPILNRTGDASLDYVSDGTTQNTIQALAGIAGLRVIGSATVFRFRNAPQDAPSIGHALGVDAILQGRLQRDGTKFLLNVELTQTTDGTILLSHSYRSDSRDLRLVQADLLHDTLQGLSFDSGKTPGHTALGPHTDNDAAYEENLRGEALIRNDSPEAFRQAVVHFTRATTLDPNFDRAWSDLAQAHLFLGIYYESPQDQMPLARAAALRALQLNPALPEAHGSLAVIDLLYDWDYAGAASELEKEGATRSAMSMLACTAHLRDQSGHPQRAEEEVRRLLAYDPQSEMLVSELGCAAYYERHYDDALRAYRMAMDLDPASPLPYIGLGRSLTELGRYQEASTVLDSFSKRNGFAPPILLAESGYTSAISGDRKNAFDRIHSIQAQAKSAYVDPYLVALIYHGLGDREDTIAWLQKAAAVHSSMLFSVLSDPMWRDWEHDAQIVAIVDKMEHKPN